MLDPRPRVMVQVGNGPRVPVVLDTGSTGLHIYQQGVRTGAGSGVTVTSQPNSIHYVDGMVQSGVVAYARLSIGGVRTGRAVPFARVSYVGCLDAAANCPGAAGINASVADGFYGILGIGLRGSPGGLINPLLALPRPFSRVWSISMAGSRGRLTLGGSLPARPLAVFHLPRTGRTLSGAPTWDDTRTKVCWAAVGMRGDGCEPTVFDTGSTFMLWYGGLLSHAPTVLGTRLVLPGTYVAAWRRSAERPFWTFTSGTPFSHHALIAYPAGHNDPASHAAVIAAVQAFYALRITYDVRHGEILIAHH